MHPNPAFRAGNEADALAFVARRAFAHIFAAIADGAMVAHAPMTRAGDRAFRFHLARANRIVPHLDGARVLLSVSDADGYITPNWYTDPAGQVPTWNYRAVEIDGVASRIDDPALIDQLDTLAAAHEPGLTPTPWTRHKMDPARFDRMRSGIVGFEVIVEAVRTTMKLSQNKPPTDRARVIAGLDAIGGDALAAAMRQTV